MTTGSSEINMKTELNFIFRYDRAFSCLICAATDVEEGKKTSMRRLSFFSSPNEIQAHLEHVHGIEYEFKDEGVAPRTRKTPKSGTGLGMSLHSCVN